MMMDDEQLLHAYARERSESAFGELVSRHIDFVYSAAVRVVNGDSHLAQDVAQTVFIDLARKAGSLPRGVVLTGWLHRHTCYTAATAVRTEHRRQAREQTAMEMRALDDNTRSEWEHVAPYLDESLNQLNPADRDALVLRFLKQQDLRAVGEALGISDDAARKRVDRALEKLHVLLKHRGATLSAAALGTALATEAVTAAPAGLAASVAGAALAGAAAGGGITATIVEVMTTSKLKLGLLSVLLIAAVTVPFALQHQAQAKLRDGEERLQQQKDQVAEQMADNRRLSGLLAEAKLSTLPDGQLRELLRVRGEVGQLRAQARDLTNSPVKIPLASMEKLWAERVAHLKEWLRENPSEQTPELRFLTERDWLNSIYPHTLETSEDCRRAMSLVRANASNKVMDQFFKAGRLYAGDNNGQSATDLSQLAPYLESPIDSAILQRYEIVAATNLVPELQKFGDWVVTQKSPINEALDSRSAYGLNAAGVADSRVTNRWNVSH